MQYRKKPVVIEAIQWNGWLADKWEQLKKMGCPTKPGEMGANTFYIPTLEGDMKVSENDWIIKGVNGEFYPCKPDIFEKTYEAVLNSNEPGAVSRHEAEKEVCDHVVYDGQTWLRDYHMPA